MTVGHAIQDSNYEANTGDYIRIFAPIATGLTLLAVSSGRKKGRVLQQKTLDKQRLLQQQYLSWSPKLNFQPGANQYGLSLRWKF